MIPVPAGVRIWIATGHTDMRRGMRGLALQVQEGLGRDPFLCVGRGYVAAPSCGAVFAGDSGFRRHIILDAFEQLKHRVLGLEARGQRTRHPRLVQPTTHHLDVGGGVAMRGSDLRMAQPSLDRQEIHAGL